MTPVKFEFYEPDGTPLANVTFEIRMAKSGFLELVDGIVMPDTIEATTDSDGTVTVLLAPSSSLYYLSVINEDADPDDRCAGGGIKYKFYVPDVTGEVRVQDLIMDPPPSTTAWDEAAMLIIVEAKAAAVVAAREAKESAEAAALSEEAVAANAIVASDAAAAALEYKNAAGDSATASQTARNEAEGFRNESLAHANEALASANASAASAGQSSDSAVEAGTYAGQSKGSADAAKLSELASAQSQQQTAADVLQTAQDAQATSDDRVQTGADVLTSTQLKDESIGLRDQTKSYRDEALAALGSITGVISDGGAIDLSGGVYPAKPNISRMWRVTVGGTVSGVTYSTGDQLFYTKDQDVFYKLDGTENVHSVAGRIGDVVLDKADVGLPLVDNTPDADKPISTAQAAAFTARTPTASNLDTTANRLVRVGDYGRNGGAAIARIVSDDANTLTVGALYAFTAGGVNVPEAAYVDHMPGGTAGYAKQIAYGYLTDKQYVRTQTAGVWSAWTSSVEIIDALTSNDPAKALSARQGKVLYGLLLANNTTLQKFYYNVAQGQTVITGPDINGLSLSYVPGTAFLADKDGWTIQIEKDYTASSGTSLVLTTPAEQSCQISITVFGAFTVADHYTKAEADAKIAALALKSASKADIVGIVRQAAGVPTGAIIEISSNAAGEYVKYANGTMVCRFGWSGILSLDMPLMGAYVSGWIAWTFPAPFISRPTVNVTPRDDTALFGIASTGGNGATENIRLGQIASSGAFPRAASFVAVGRWF